MAKKSISDLYRDEGPGEKYGGILNAVQTVELPSVGEALSVKNSL